MDAFIADDGIETSPQLSLLLAQIAVLTFKSKSMTILPWAGSTPGGHPQPWLEPPENLKLRAAFHNSQPGFDFDCWHPTELIVFPSRNDPLSQIELVIPPRGITSPVVIAWQLTMLKVMAQFRNRHRYWFSRQIGGAGHCENVGGEPPNF